MDAVDAVNVVDRAGMLRCAWQHRFKPVRDVLCCCALVLGTLALGLPAQELPTDPQADGYVQQQWKSSDGLPQDSVETVMQTRDGHIWIATERGLTRFNGRQFSNFNRKNTPALRDGYIASLFEARDGTLWIGTSLSGLAAYKDGVFRSVSLGSSRLQGKVSAIQQDPRGDLWLGTSNYGVVRLHNGLLTSFGTNQGLAGVTVLAMLIDHRGVLWVSTAGGGLQRWDGQRFVAFSAAGGHTLAAGKVTALFEDAGHTLWVGAGSSVTGIGLGEDSEAVRRHETASRPVSAIFVDRRGSLWVGTEGGGLELHPSGVAGTGDTEGAVTRFGAKNGFPADTVQSICQDREGSLWLGTDGGGVVQLRRADFRTYAGADGLAHDNVRSIVPGSDGSIWLGTSHGLSRWHGGSIANYPLPPNFPNFDFRALLEDRDGTLWIGTDGAGLYRMGPRDAQPSPVHVALPSPVVMALAQDGAGHIWAGTPHGLAQLVHGQTKLLNTQNGLPNDVILSLHADRLGGIWIGTAHGLARWSEAGLRAYGTQTGADGDAIVSFFDGAGDRMWIGTYDGLLRWDGSSFRRFRQEDGLLSDTVTDVIESRQGDLWLRSNTEVSRIAEADLDRYAEGRLDRLRPVVYDRKDGMLTTVTGGGQPESLRLGDGTLWFGSQQGLATVNPAHLRSSSLPPPVEISEVVVDGRHLSLSGASRLAPGRGSLEFQFAALSFVEPGNLRFKYQLAGFDKGWIDAGTRTAAFYTNIPPGSYTFRVVACNRDGVWNMTGAQYSFTLPAHFHQTLPFYGLCALVLAGLGALAYSTRIHVREADLISRQHELEELVTQRTEQLEMEKQQLLLAREALRRQATLDGLTGLLNRVAIMDLLEQEMARAARTGRPLSLVMIDIDHFKTVNDTHGHLVGDEVIRETALRLKESVRTYDRIGRYGGEEFLMFMPDFDACEDRLRLEQTRRFTAQHPVTSRSLAISLTCSFGVAVLRSGQTPTLEAFLDCADRALYEAKRAGRNRVMYDESGLMNLPGACKIPGREERAEHAGVEIRLSPPPV